MLNYLYRVIYVVCLKHLTYLVSYNLLYDTVKLHQVKHEQLHLWPAACSDPR